MNFVRQNYQALLAAAGALYTLLSIINGLIKNPEAHGFFAKLLDGLSFIQRATASGSVKLPLMMSRRAPHPAVPPAIPSATIALLLLPLLFISACSWGTCVLGQLKAAQQPLIEDVTSDLASADYLALLGQLGLTAGEAVVTCTVQAVETYEKTKQTKPANGVLAATTPSVVLNHAQSYLAARKKVACGDSRRPS